MNCQIGTIWNWTDKFWGNIFQIDLKKNSFTHSGKKVQTNCFLLNFLCSCLAVLLLLKLVGSGEHIGTVRCVHTTPSVFHLGLWSLPSDSANRVCTTLYCEKRKKLFLSLYRNQFKNSLVNNSSNSVNSASSVSIIL